MFEADSCHPGAGDGEGEAGEEVDGFEAFAAAAASLMPGFMHEASGGMVDVADVQAVDDSWDFGKWDCDVPEDVFVSGAPAATFLEPVAPEASGGTGVEGRRAFHLHPDLSEGEEVTEEGLDGINVFASVSLEPTFLPEAGGDTADVADVPAVDEASVATGDRVNRAGFSQVPDLRVLALRDDDEASDEK